MMKGAQPITLFWTTIASIIDTMNALKTHPNVKFHYKPTSASWLNMVEIWFGILSRKVLKDASFDSDEELKSAIVFYMKACNEHSTHPFQWRKRGVKSSQIRNTLTNLCN